MKSRGVLWFVPAAICGLPLTGWAQAVVITAPLQEGTAAPALSLPMLAGLAVLLCGVAFYALRQRSAHGIAILMGVVIVGGVAVTHAVDELITLQGPDCSERSIHPYDPNESTNLSNDCPNPMEILEIEVDCGDMDVLESGSQPRAIVPFCMEGDVLENTDICRLPDCLN